MSTTISPAFTASGLASGMDTNSMVDQLVALESQPITLLQKRQAGLKTQVSLVADIVSKLSALQAAADDLGSKGVLGVKVTSSTAAFSAVAGSDAAAGRYSVHVDRLALAAKWRSGAYASATSPVAAGTLTLGAPGGPYPIDTTGLTLADLAAAIRKSGAPVSATVLSSGTSSYLSVTARDTGYAVGGSPDDALTMSFTPSGASTPDPAAFTRIQEAQNARFSVDGLGFERSTNVVSDAIPGLTFTLSQAQAEADPAQDLVVQNDVEATQGRLQTFVDAYDGVMALVQRQLDVTKDTDRTSSLAGDSAIQGLQARLQALTTPSAIAGSSPVRTLADLGVETAKDGSLSIDASTLAAAVGRDPSAVNAIFSTASTGLTALVDGLVEAETRAGDGILTLDAQTLNDGVSRLGDDLDQAQARVDAYRQSLLARFAAMEQTISSLKSIGNYLTQLSQAQQSSSK